jgi:hypothetical protein
VAQRTPFPAAPAAAPTNNSGNDLIAVSARLKIADSTGQSYGSGTVIDSRNGEALIIHCGRMPKPADITIKADQRQHERRRCNNVKI